MVVSGQRVMLLARKPAMLTGVVAQPMAARPALAERLVVPTTAVPLLAAVVRPMAVRRTLGMPQAARLALVEHWVVLITAVHPARVAELVLALAMPVMLVTLLVV